MVIIQKDCFIHWNYFLAIEHDLIDCSRYIEFSNKNNNAYSIEFAHLLFASCSEVDVICKQICRLINSEVEVNGIDNYRPVIIEKFPQFKHETVYINRYGLSFKPWINWRPGVSPFWWQGYNKVKHERNDYFQRANLKNVLRSVGGLLIATIYYYLLEFSKEMGEETNIREVTYKLSTESELLNLREDYYYSHLVG